MIQQQLFSPIPQTIENFSRFPLPQATWIFLCKMVPDSSRTLNHNGGTNAFWPRLRPLYGLSGCSEGIFPKPFWMLHGLQVTGLLEYFVVFFQDSSLLRLRLSKWR